MSRLLLSKLCLFAVFTWLSAQPAEARACTCDRASPAILIEGVDRVFLARMHENIEVERGYQTEMDVLYTLKGQASDRFLWKRSDLNPLCGPEYKADEVHLVFVKGGKLSLCSGNWGMPEQIRALPAYIKAAKQPTKDVELRYMSFALSSALAGYTHNRPKISVHYSGLRGKHIDVPGLRFHFRPSLPSRRSSKTAVIIDQAVQMPAERGPLVMVSGRYPREGIRFQVLLHEGSKRPEILFQSVVEH